MTGQWTPGPWDASAPDGTYHDVIRIFADADPAGAAPVAICPQRNSAIMEVLAGSTDDTTEAARNARLIAAAPELLELVLQYRDDMKYPPDADSRLRRSERIREVIAKATGAA